MGADTSQAAAAEGGTAGQAVAADHKGTYSVEAYTGNLQVGVAPGGQQGTHTANTGMGMILVGQHTAHMW